MPPQTGSPNLGDLKKKSVRGGVVTLGAQGVNVLIQLLSTVVLARLLSPDDYGVVAMVLAVTSFAGLFRDLGLSAASIQKGNLEHAQINSLFWLNALMGAILTILTILVSPLVAKFYQKPEIALLTVALSITFLISSLGTQHGALLEREMRLGQKSFALIGGTFLNFIIALICSYKGLGYWSLIWGTIGGTVGTTCLLVYFSKFVPGKPNFSADIKGMIKFGAQITGFDLANYFHRNLDNVLIGRYSGADALGYYSRAYQILMLPINNLRGPINAVAFSAMSRLQDNPDQFRSYYRKVSSILAFVSMPLVAYLGALSYPIIELALGKAWTPCASIFVYLSISGFIQPVASLRGLVLMSTGQGGRYLKWGIINSVCVSIGFLAGVPWGPQGVAIGYAIANYAILYPSMQLAFGATSLRPIDFFASIAKPALASILSVIILIGASLASSWHSALFEIAAGGILFSVSYIGLFCLFPGGVADLKSYINFRNLLKSKS